MKYYYLSASLPYIGDIHFKKGLDFTELYGLIKRNLNASDQQQLELLTWPNDLRNLINKCSLEVLGKPVYPSFFDPFCYVSGSEKNIKESISRLPESFINILSLDFDQVNGERFREIEKQIWSSFYEFIGQKGNDFVRRFYDYDRNLRSLIISMQFEIHHKNLEHQFLSEDPLNISLLKGKWSAFEKYLGIDYVTTLADAIAKDNPVDLEASYRMVKWQFIDGMLTNRFFELENILGFYLKMQDVQRFEKANPRDETKFIADQLLKSGIPDSLNKLLAA